MAGWAIATMGALLVIFGRRRLGLPAAFVIAAGLLYSAGGVYIVYDAYRTYSPGVPASIWVEH
jgi:hypothetical protein